MNIKWIGLLIISCLGSFAPQALSATVLTYAYDATVTSIHVSGDTSLLPSSGSGLVVGQTINGSFTYDTSASSSFIGGSMYSYTANLYATGSLTINLPTTTVSGSTPYGYSSEVFNSTPANGGNGFVVFGPYSDNVVAGTHEIYLAYQLDLYDRTASVLNSLSLPTSLNLSDFDFRGLSIQEVDFSGGQYNVALELTSLTEVAAVPEPSTWAMMLLGFAGVSFMAYRRSRKDNGLALAAV
jgi:hypothetical protein